jgi:hypothetical protein
MAKAFQEIFCFRYEIGLYYWEWLLRTLHLTLLTKRF